MDKIHEHLATLSERLRLSAINYLPGRKTYLAELNEAADIVDKYAETIAFLDRIEATRRLTRNPFVEGLLQDLADHLRPCQTYTSRTTEAAITLELS